MNTLLFLSFLIALTTSLLAVPKIIKLAFENNWLDTPGGRKQHQTPTPSLGGIAIFAGFWLGVTVFSIIQGVLISILPIILAGSILFALGLIDDLKEVAAKKKLFIQFAVAALLFHFDFCRLDSFFGVFGIKTLAPGINFICSVLITVLIINAYNLIDGINGLSGSLTVFSSLVFGFIFLQFGLPIWAGISFCLAAATLGFLKYNFGKAIIFMGDNGSTFVGMIISILFFQLIHINHPATDMLPIGLALIAIPVFDLLRVFFYRISQKRGPFSPDRSHIHHILLKIMGDTNSVVYSLLGLNVALLCALATLNTVVPTLIAVLLIGALVWTFPFAIKINR